MVGNTRDQFSVAGSSETRGVKLPCTISVPAALLMNACSADQMLASGRLCTGTVASNGYWAAP
jgi:hypothetical protein